jgi:predicted anti-sigma-YlaC factor YlaD
VRNFRTSGVDYSYMTCERMRVALSARLDGEDPGMPAAVLDAHLDGCEACSDWLARAERLTRAVRLRSVEVPDLTASVLAAAAADPQVASGRQAESARAALARDRARILRLAVAVAAVAQLALALPVLFGAHLAGNPHSTREMASFDVAVAVGFALAAWRPQRARTFLPVAVVLAACLAVTTAMDVANSTTGLLHEVGHLAAVAQAGLLWALGRVSGGPPQRGGGHRTGAAASPA